MARCVDFYTPEMVQPAWENNWTHEVVEQQWSTILSNGEEMIVSHIGKGHTDGDLIVYFKNSNVLVMGDVLLNYWYPFIDLHNGGTVRGKIDSLKKIIANLDENTTIVPGHGKVGDKTELLENLQMLETVTARIEKYIAKGYSLEKIQDKKPTMEFDTSWKGPVESSRFVELIYYSLRDTQRHPNCKS